MVTSQQHHAGARVRLADLHTVRAAAELDATLARSLAQCVPGVGVVVSVDPGDEHGLVVRAVAGAPTAHRVGSRIAAEQLAAFGAVRELRFGERAVGLVAVDAALDAQRDEALDELLLHYVTALVNQTLDAEARQSTNEYCAILQAFEEGIVLFQESDPEAVMARLLALAGSMTEAAATALYVYDEVGNAESSLVLKQSLGMPEPLLAGLRATDGRSWPDPLVDAPVELHRWNTDGTIANIAPGCAPPILDKVITLPMRYHGVTAGVCVLFNPVVAPGQEREIISRLQSFGSLGAALLHRLSLERLREEGVSLARELEIAQQIQKRLVPSRAPASDSYEFAWHTLAAKSIGGDYVDFVESDLGDVYAIVADASGHGVNSALLMSSFRSNYRGTAPWLDPNDLGASLNNEVVDEVGPTGMFITAAMARLQDEDGMLTICSAGHNPVMLFRSATQTVERIESHGPPLGFLQGMTYEQFDARMDSGDVMVLYTDGITEATDRTGEMFGEDRLADLLAEQCGELSAQQVLDAVLAAVAAFSGEQQQEDDVTLLVLKRT